MEPNLRKKRDLQDIKIPVKIKLGSLWTSLMFCYLYGDYFSLYVPGQIQTFTRGETLLDNPARLFAASVLLAVPAMMVFLTIGLKPALSRWLNIILGIVYTTVMLLAGFTSLTAWWTFYVFFAVIEISLTLLIVWYAWKWPSS